MISFWTLKGIPSASWLRVSWKACVLIVGVGMLILSWLFSVLAIFSAISVGVAVGGGLGSLGIFDFASLSNALLNREEVREFRA